MDKSYLIIGGCGVGKTFVMKQLIARFEVSHPNKIGLYHFNSNEFKDIAILGKYDGTMFEGSDRLAMNIMSDNDKVKSLLASYIVIAEGDRFTNQTYINTFKPTILRIKGDGAEGRLKRGSAQTERHIKSMTTRVNNIIPNFEFNNSQECYNFIVNELTGGQRTTEPYKHNIQTLF